MQLTRCTTYSFTMSKIIADLNFSGTCREAMTFYQQCLGGELHLIGFEGAPSSCPKPPATA